MLYGLVVFAVAALLFFVKQYTAARRNVLAHAGPKTVVITGASKGLGLALAQEFCDYGDRVVLAARAPKPPPAVEDLIRESKGYVHYVPCDVRDAAAVDRLAAYAREKVGDVHIWVNNAALTHTARVPLAACEAAALSDIIQTNVLGTLYGCRAALRLMLAQECGGHVFNITGRGSRGEGTPCSIAYGASKSAIPQVTKTLRQELAGRPAVGVHDVSPGMVMTDLLAASATNARSKRIFNILAERADVVAAWLAPRMRLQAGPAGDLQFLTVWGVLFRFATFWMRSGRFYNRNGDPVPGAWGPPRGPPPESKKDQ